MPPSRTSLDPDGHYATLGVEPSATRADIVAAFRAKVRLLHPDVIRTGNSNAFGSSDAFVAVKQAYDVLSNAQRRAAYDCQAREAAMRDAQLSAAGMPTFTARAATASPAAMPLRQPRFSDLPVAVWAVVAAFLCLSVYQAVSHLLAPAQVANAGIRPNAATVEPLSPTAHRAVLYGPTPLRLAGTPNFYVVPAGTPTVLWQEDSGRKTLSPVGELPPFSAVQAIRAIRQTGMLEVLVNDQATGFISADHLAPGNAAAARLAYCGYNAGPLPYDGELLERHATGAATLVVENRAVQPAVIKLRDENGAVIVAVFLGPGSHVDLDKLPEGLFRPEFAIGELWSRACNMFAAGMRARRMDGVLAVPSESPIIIAPDLEEPTTSDISDQAFERN